MSYVQAKNNDEVKFQCNLKDNNNLELPSKPKGLKMSFCEKIMIISCRIEFSEHARLISLILRPLYRMLNGHT